MHQMGFGGGGYVHRDREGSRIIIDKIHHEIHKKNMFDAHRVVTSVADLASIYYLIKTYDKAAHLIVSLDCEGKSRFMSYMYSVLTSIGTEIPSFNRYIDEAPSAATKVYHTPIITSNGTKRFDQLVLGGTGNKTTGASTSSRIESVLAPNMELLLIITNVSTSLADIGFGVEWYEEDY